MTTERNDLEAMKRLIANAQGYPGRSMEEIQLAGSLGRLIEEVESLRGEIDGTDHLAGNPSKWGLRAMLNGACAQRDEADRWLAKIWEVVSGGERPQDHYLNRRSVFDMVERLDSAYAATVDLCDLRERQLNQLKEALKLLGLNPRAPVEALVDAIKDISVENKELYSQRVQFLTRALIAEEEATRLKKAHWDAIYCTTPIKDGVGTSTGLYCGKERPCPEHG